MRSKTIAGLALSLMFAAAPVAALSAQGPAPVAITPLAPSMAPLDSRLDAVAAAAYAREPVGSLTVGLVREGKLAWTGSYGSADMATHAPASARTVYRVASVTKQFTALMLLQLVNDGVVTLDDPVARYVPEIARIKGAFPGARPITLRQLASHTSGLAVEADDAAFYTHGSDRVWARTLIAALPHTRYTAAPGTRYAYSNVDYAILALALARAARTPYTVYVKRKIFWPLGMTHTGFSPPSPLAELAHGYVMRDGQPDGRLPERELAGRGYKVASGGAYSTVEDLAKFVAFQMGYGPDSVLPREALIASRQLLVYVGERTDDPHGVGFQVFSGRDFTLFGHVGGIAGYRSLTAYDPTDGIGVIVLRNVSEGVIDPVTLGQTLVRAARL